MAITRFKEKKKICWLIILVVAVLLFLSACDNRDTSGNDPGEPLIIDLEEYDEEEIFVPVKYGTPADEAKKFLPSKKEVPIKEREVWEEANIEWEPALGYKSEEPGLYDFVGDIERSDYYLKATVEVLEEGKGYLEIQDFSDQFPNSVAGESYGDIEITVSEITDQQVDDIDVSLHIESEGGNVEFDPLDENIDSLAGNEERVNFDIEEINDVGEYTAVVTAEGENTNRVEKKWDFRVSDVWVDAENSEVNIKEENMDEKEIKLEISLNDINGEPMTGDYNIRVGEGDIFEGEVAFEEGTAELDIELENYINVAVIEVENMNGKWQKIGEFEFVNVYNKDEEKGYKTISQALKEAKALDEIVVYPGDYSEEGTISIDKGGIDLRADVEEGESVVLDSVEITGKEVGIFGFDIKDSDGKGVDIGAK
ncbi:MAG: hypothetical protein ACOC5A_02850, partial [Halanaerobiales bacterium]